MFHFQFIEYSSIWYTMAGIPTFVLYFHPSLGFIWTGCAHLRPIYLICIEMKKGAEAMTVRIEQELTVEKRLIHYLHNQTLTTPYMQINQYKSF